jgi:hypothetical protein
MRKPLITKNIRTPRSPKHTCARIFRIPIGTEYWAAKCEPITSKIEIALKPSREGIRLLNATYFLPGLMKKKRKIELAFTIGF